MDISQTESLAIHHEWPYAGFWRRVAATVIDNLILIIPGVLFGAFTFGVGGVAVWLAYGTYFESSEQRATWGKQACGLTVESVTGERLSVGTALFRQVLKFVGNILSIITWLIFFVPAAFTARKQGLHDLAVSSVVRHEPGKGIPSLLVGVIAAILPAVFVVGILAAIAIPAYQDFVTRARVVEGRAQAAPLRAAVEASFASTGKLPLDQSQLGSVNAPEGRANVTYKDGRIEIAIKGSQRPQGMIYLTPIAEADRITWKCEAENIRPGQLPRDCR
ncbi:MAG: RDD family protein [Betaproteobacteria bacterium]